MISEIVFGMIFVYIISLMFILLLLHFNKKLGAISLMLFGISLLTIPETVAGIGNLIYAPILIIIVIGIYIFFYGFVNDE